MIEIVLIGVPCFLVGVMIGTAFWLSVRAHQRLDKLEARHWHAYQRATLIEDDLASQKERIDQALGMAEPYGHTPWCPVATEALK